MPEESELLYTAKHPSLIMYRLSFSASAKSLQIGSGTVLVGIFCAEKKDNMGDPLGFSCFHIVVLRRGRFEIMQTKL